MIARGPRFADAFDLDEVGKTRAHHLGQRAEAFDHVTGDRLRQPRDLAQQPVPARLQRRIEVELRREVQHRRDDAQVEELVVGDMGETRRDLHEHPLRRLDEVVLAHEPQVGEHTSGELFQLQLDEAPVETELDDVPLDLLRDPAHHLRALQHGDDVADGHEVFDLERGQRAR